MVDLLATVRAERLLAELEPAIDVRAPLGTLSPGHRQIVQIAARLDDAKPWRVIVFDEPTSSLSIAEVDRLLAIIRGLPRGITCIYVSHRMSEIFAACVIVLPFLAYGKYVATTSVKEIDESRLVEQMIGRKVPPPVRRARPAATTSDAALMVENLRSPGRVHDVSLSVAAGEILGVGGLVVGRSELLDAIFGLDPAARGVVRAGGIRLCTPDGPPWPSGLNRGGPCGVCSRGSQTSGTVLSA